MDVSVSSVIMSLVSVEFCWFLLRYQKIKGSETYGNAVLRHLTTILKALQREPASRSGWLRLIKDICDYMKVNPTGKKNAELKAADLKK